MIKSIITTVLIVSLNICNLVAQEKKAYTLFNSLGKEIDYGNLINEISKADIVFIGEIHNCAITHWLEYEITKSLYSKHKKDLSLGMEMLESDNQLIIDEYMSRTIAYDRFEAEARLWDNYYTDYSPSVLFAKENNIPLIATNIPRRYSAMVNKDGLESLNKLSEQAKGYIAPLPIDFSFKEEDKESFMMMQLMSGKKNINYEYLSQAQAIKDATMAWFIAKNFKGKFIHFNGNFHSDSKGGIIPYLIKLKPNLKIINICAIRQEEINKLDEENMGRGDYYICVPEDMSSSY